MARRKTLYNFAMSNNLKWLKKLKTVNKKLVKMSIFKANSTNSQLKAPVHR
jgi:hypothetical protein